MTSPRDPIVLVRWCLLAWGVFTISASLPFVLDGREAAAVGIGLGVVTLGLAIWCWRSGEWLRPLFAELFAAGFALVVAGAMTSLDEYVIGGVQALIVVAIGAVIVHRLPDRERDR